MPEAKTFMGRADLCVKAQDAGEGHSQRLECISEVGTLTRAAGGGGAQTRGPP